VAKGGEIARVYQSEEAVNAARRIRELQNERDDLETVRKQTEAEALSPQTLAAQLDELYRGISAAAATGTPDEVEELRRRLTRLLNYKNTDTADTDTAVYAQRISAIDAEIASLRSAVGKYTTVKASDAGYFYSSGVGHVALAKKEVERLTCTQIDRLTEQGKSAAQQSSPMLVTGYTFYYVFNIPSIQAALLPAGSLQMIFPGSDEKIVKAQIVASNKEGGEDSRTAVAVSVISGSENILGNGIFTAQIHVGQQTGLRVPRSALRTAEVNGEEAAGVYVMVGPVMEFRRVEVLMADGDHVICENTGKNGWLELYDEVVVSGKHLSDDKVLQ